MIRFLRKGFFLQVNLKVVGPERHTAHPRGLIYITFLFILFNRIEIIFQNVTFIHFSHNVILNTFIIYRLSFVLLFEFDNFYSHFFIITKIYLERFGDLLLSIKQI